MFQFHESVVCISEYVSLMMPANTGAYFKVIYKIYGFYKLIDKNPNALMNNKILIYY